MVEGPNIASTAAGLQEQLIATLLASLVPANALDTQKKPRPDDIPALNLATLTVCSRLDKLFMVVSDKC